MKGLYIHIPFCVKKCKYCDFNSFEFSPEDKKSYLSALFKNIELYKNEAVDSVFIGGGTPTSLNSDELNDLLLKIKSVFCLSSDCEITVEMNPKTVDLEKLMVLKNAGVTRLSVGVQSFSNDELMGIGRIHNAEDAKSTVEMIKKCGFGNYSLDLMSALPSQSVESFKKSLSTAVSLSPVHISCYSLILEEGTPLYEEYLRGELNLPDEDTEREMYEYAVEYLAKNGYDRYEISNFSKPGFESKHNIKYWQCDEYIGVGLSAHSYIAGVRFSMTDDFEKYIMCDFSRYNENTLTKEDKMSEFAFMGLRMAKGIDKTEFKRRFETSFDEVFGDSIIKFKNMGMIIDDTDFCRLTDTGISVSNSIMCEFIL